MSAVVLIVAIGLPFALLGVVLLSLLRNGAVPLGSSSRARGGGGGKTARGGAGSSLSRVGKYDPKTGIGRGAPGFQTAVQRIPVPAHIVARIRAGEEVSAEEITAAQEEVARRLEREREGEAQTKGGGGGGGGGGGAKKKGGRR